MKFDEKIIENLLLLVGFAMGVWSIISGWDVLLGSLLILLSLTGIFFENKKELKEWYNKAANQNKEK
jgi:hypothetical protein